MFVHFSFYGNSIIDHGNLLYSRRLAHLTAGTPLIYGTLNVNFCYSSFSSDFKSTAIVIKSCSIMRPIGYISLTEAKGDLLLEGHTFYM